MVNEKNQTETQSGSMAGNLVDRGNERSEAERAEQVDQLANWTPTTEQSARENAGAVRRPDDGRPSDLGVSDTPNAVPGGARSEGHPHDFSHRGDKKIQGEDVPTSGDERERRNEETHL